MNERLEGQAQIVRAIVSWDAHRERVRELVHACHGSNARDLPQRERLWRRSRQLERLRLGQPLPQRRAVRRRRTRPARDVEANAARHALLGRVPEGDVPVDTALAAAVLDRLPHEVLPHVAPMHHVKRSDRARGKRDLSRELLAMRTLRGVERQGGRVAPQLDEHTLIEPAIRARPPSRTPKLHVPHADAGRVVRHRRQPRLELGPSRVDLLVAIEPQDPVRRRHVATRHTCMHVRDHVLLDAHLVGEVVRLGCDLDDRPIRPRLGPPAQVLPRSVRARVVADHAVLTQRIQLAEHAVQVTFAYDLVAQLGEPKHARHHGPHTGGSFVLAGASMIPLRCAIPCLTISPALDAASCSVRRSS